MRADLKHPTRPDPCDTSRSAEHGACVPPDASCGHGATPPGAADDAARDEVLDVRGAAQLLRIGRNAVYDLVARNAIPHRRLGKQIRFSRAAIMRWFTSWSPQGAKEGQ